MKRGKAKRAREHGDGYPIPRIYHRKMRGKKSARLLIKCGDCANKFEIYYGPDGDDLEIAGVFASIENWRKILLPLLSKTAISPARRISGRESEERQIAWRPGSSFLLRPSYFLARHLPRRRFPRRPMENAGVAVGGLRKSEAG